LRHMATADLRMDPRVLVADRGTWTGAGNPLPLVEQAMGRQALALLRFLLCPSMCADNLRRDGPQ
jgi:hypothetical protein